MATSKNRYLSDLQGTLRSTFRIGLTATPGRVLKTDASGFGTWQAITVADVPIMVGADGVLPGTAGLVPAPFATDDTKFLRGDGVFEVPPVGVLSVGMTVPSFLSVAGSPVTGAGTLAVTLATQNQNLIFGGPATGAAATPTFRALVAADIPSLPASIIGSGIIPLTRGGTGANLNGTGGTGQFVKQVSAGAVFTVDEILSADLTNALVSPPPIGTTTPAYGQFTGLLVTNGALTAQILVTSTGSGANEEIDFQKSGSNRWGVLANSNLESGANTGSNFEIRAYADDGISTASTPISIVRATGKVTIPTSLALSFLSTNNAFVYTDASGNVSSRILLATDIPSLDTAKITTGIFTVARGGTGLATLTANNLIVGAGTSNVTFIAPSTSRNALFSNGTTWSSRAVQQLDLPTFTGSTGVADGAQGAVPQPLIADTAKFLRGDGTWAAGNAGTVTSVGMTVPSWYSISGSPVTSSGTLAVTAATGQIQNGFLAAPSGSTGALSVRLIAAADINTPLITSLATPPTIGGTTPGIVNASAVNVINTVASSIINVRASAAQLREVAFQTGTTTRWSIRTNTTAEGGSNAGADLEIIAYTDAGSANMTPLTITRSTGVSGFSRSVWIGTGAPTTPPSDVYLGIKGATTPGIQIENTNAWVLAARTTSTFGLYDKTAALERIGVDTSGRWSVDAAAFDAAMSVKSPATGIIGLKVAPFSTGVSVDIFQAVNGSGSVIFSVSKEGIPNFFLRNTSTSSADQHVVFYHATSGTVANGFGSDIQYKMDTNGSTFRDVMLERIQLSDAADATRRGKYELFLYDVGTPRSVMQAVAISGEIQLGFAGATAITRPDWTAWTGTATRTAIATGSATATQCAEAIKALIDDLISYGLFK